MRFLAVFILIVIVGCGLTIGGRALRDDGGPLPVGPTSPAVFGPEIMG